MSGAIIIFCLSSHQASMEMDATGALVYPRNYDEMVGCTRNAAQTGKAGVALYSRVQASVLVDHVPHVVRLQTSGSGLDIMNVS